MALAAEIMEKYSAITVTKKDGSEPLQLDGQVLPYNVLSFWQWSSSDLVGNALRGKLAEYIVAIAVGSNEKIRTEWDAYDVVTPEGIKVEVKSGAYIQSWAQTRLSNIQLGIRPTLGWNAKTNTYSSQIERQSDVYVFCVLEHKNQETINPLNLNQWVFYIIATSQLNRATGKQKTISLSSLLKLNPRKANYGEIDHAIRRVVSGSS
jgi:hypothetical protein